jgi:hypothetical protein
MRLITTILALLITAAAAYGQVPDTLFSGNQHKRGKIIEEELALTDKQSRQWHTLNKAFETQAKEILQNNALSPAQKQEHFNKAQQDHENKIKALLTEDQYHKYLQWNAKRRERWRMLKRMEDRQLPGKTAPGKS